jgi:hypothetical protein
MVLGRILSLFQLRGGYFTISKSPGSTGTDVTNLTPAVAKLLAKE